MKISLIIPAYNEERIIESTLRKLNSFIEEERDTWEVLIVDDGSTDKTLRILKNFEPKFFNVVSYKPNKGKGFAIKRGVDAASGDYICFLDSDLPYSFDNLKLVLSQLKKFDITIGSRTLSLDNNEQISVSRRILGKGFGTISSLILSSKIKDKQCGLKAFKKNVAKDLFSKQTMNGFSFDAEILYLAKRKNYTISEVKATVLKDHQSKNSKVNLLKEPVTMFFDLLKIRLNGILGKYG